MLATYCVSMMPKVITLMKNNSEVKALEKHKIQCLLFYRLSYYSTGRISWLYICYITYFGGQTGFWKDNGILKIKIMKMHTINKNAMKKVIVSLRAINASLQIF